MANILVTGGAGYIGSHTCLELLCAGHNVVVVDNLQIGSLEALARVQALAQRSLVFIQCDIRHAAGLDAVFSQYAIDAVIHFAGLKAVSESMDSPLPYFDQNIAGSIALLQAMQRAGVFTLVFSSSAAVYGADSPLPYHEAMRLDLPYSNYGFSKWAIEQVLERTALAWAQWSIALLRYFNPVGAHSSGQIGEDPKGVPFNLVPYLTQVAAGRREKLFIYGSDYSTGDGTCERDFIHVVDLARAHVLALENRLSCKGCRAWNIGAGLPVSVLKIKNTFEAVNGVYIPFEYAARRPGDLAVMYADCRRAWSELGWRAELTLEEMLRDSWTWQRNNPYGYLLDYAKSHIA